MNETKFDWDDLRLFLAVARAEGLAPAAATTGKSAPTLGRRMLALERRLGRDLFRRMPRGYALTDAGQTLFAQVMLLEREVAPLIETDAAQLVPIVKISAGAWVTHILCERVREIIGQDHIRPRFTAADEVTDIGRREAVIGIRNRRPEGTSLAGRRVARVRFAAFATSDAVTKWARVLGTTPSAKWVHETSQRHSPIEVTSPRNALDLALSGAARNVLPTFIGHRFESLKQVSPLIENLEHDQWLVLHHEDRFIPEVRRVIDRIYAILRETSVTA